MSEQIITVEIVLKGQLLEEMEIVAEILGVPLEMLVVMACQKFVQRINEEGFPRVVGVGFALEGGEA